MYCINIAIQTFLTSFAYFLMEWFFPSTIHNPRKDSDLIAQKCHEVFIFFRASTMNGYPYFGTLTVFLAYLGYARPLLFARLTKHSKLLIIFAIGYIWTFVNVVLELPRIYMVSFFPIFLPTTNLFLFMWTHVTLNLVLYVIMIWLYALTIAQIQSIRRLLRTSNASSSLRHHWNTLISILIYCTPPNIFTAIALAGFSCDSLNETVGYNIIEQWENIEAYDNWLEVGDVCSDIRIWSQGATNIRLFVSLSTALIAFKEYRKPIVKIVSTIWAYVYYVWKVILFTLLPSVILIRLKSPMKPKSTNPITVNVHTLSAIQ
ncbi:hypothetical protein L596_013870 [Steinernema carpocapsae]|uniref:Serpentine receptor class gamma n=1 Tax=Steinernema carpocapsae TaxID=34508 RepID=A0A4U5P1G1_STECR|nr:hypothetical protein L596_013870 [Steinernema carpocapsae]